MIPAREVAPRALGEALRRQPMSAAKVRFAWQSSVGTSIARVTSVVLDETGTLHVNAQSEHWRREISRSIVVIKERLAHLLGPDAVKRVSVKRSRT